MNESKKSGINAEAPKVRSWPPMLQGALGAAGVVISAALAAWLSGLPILKVVGDVATWLCEPSGFPRALDLAAFGLILAAAIFGAATVYRSVRRPAWVSRFRRGVFHSMLWTWSYEKESGRPEAIAPLCPFDGTALLNGASATSYCPSCRRAAHGVKPTEEVVAMIYGEVFEGRWRKHHKELSVRKEALKLAIGDQRKWNGGASIEENARRRDQMAEVPPREGRRQPKP